MKVFIWKSHGEVYVYALTDAVAQDVLEVLEQEGFEIDSEKDYSWQEIDTLVSEAQESDSDMFEYGSGVVKVREKWYD